MELEAFGGSTTRWFLLYGTSVYGRMDRGVIVLPYLSAIGMILYAERQLKCLTHTSGPFKGTASFPTEWRWHKTLDEN